MDSSRKKELKAQYKLMKPHMGVYIMRAKFEDKCFIHATKDLRGVMNGAMVRLGAKMHPNRELQKAWSEHGPDAFIIEILATLEYDKDDSKTDYSDDLALLQMEWEEKLADQGLTLYKK